MNANHEIVLFESKDGKVSLPVSTDGQTIWLSKAQMAQLFEKDTSVISRHIRNAIQEGEIDPKVVCAKFAHTTRQGTMIAESKPAEKEMMVNLVMTFLE